MSTDKEAWATKSVQDCTVDMGIHVVSVTGLCMCWEWWMWRLTSSPGAGHIQGTGGCTQQWWRRSGGDPLRQSSSWSVCLKRQCSLPAVLLRGEALAPRAPTPWHTSGLRGCSTPFPPFRLLPNLLQRIGQEEVHVILVALDWAHMTWFLWVTPLLDGTMQKLPVWYNGTLRSWVYL